MKNRMSLTELTRSSHPSRTAPSAGSYEQE